MRRAALLLVCAAMLCATSLMTWASTARADSSPPDPTDPANPTTVAGDGLPTVQIDGVVWAQAVVGNTVYAGGNFTTARPAGAAPGVDTTPRSNFLAYDIRTGALITSFAPVLNGQVRAITVSPDKSRIYVGGDFNTVDGVSVKRIAAFDTATGNRITSFNPKANYNVHAIVATASTVWFGGNFSAVGSVARTNLAAVRAYDGAILDWAPQATGGVVNAMTINPGGTKVVVGGSFTALNGSSNPGYGLGMLDTVTGLSLPFAVNSIVRDGTTAGAITSLVTDGSYVYGSGYTYTGAGGTMEGQFAAGWTAGEVRWINDCHGDSYSVAILGDVLYSVGHAHYCENVGGFTQGAGGVGAYPYNRAIGVSLKPTGTVTWEPNNGRYANYAGQPSPSPLAWYPAVNAGTFTGSTQGGYSLAASGSYLVMGGEFTKVNSVGQQGLVRFATKDVAPNKRGPSLFNATYPLNVSSTESGSARINWPTNRDLDNDYLTYKVYRDEQRGANLVYQTSRRGDYWNPYTTGFTDTGLVPGSTHQYRVAVTDPFGNIANTSWTSVTVASSGTDSPYVKSVYDSQPTDYWRFDDVSGTASDRVGFRPATVASGVARGATGAISGDSSAAYTFNGAGTGYAATAVQESPPDTFSLEAWVKTTSTKGGKIVGWGSNATGTSTKADRHLYVDNAGHLLFGVKPDASRDVLTSPATYRDGKWHQVVGTLSSSGMRLYVDGKSVGFRPDVTVGEHLALGYWRIGGDSLGGWPSAPSSGYLAGSVDEVATYKHELTGKEVADHYAAGTGAITPNVPPQASFTYTKSGLNGTFDGSTSVDVDGSIASYNWDFGDGGSATGVNATHTFPDTGTYTVRLSVTDDAGGTATSTQEVSVQAPNVAPKAAFTTAVDTLSLQVDGSGSTDTEGPVASYAWDFGDGATDSGPTVSHTYAKAGTYDVTLTVTDADGATDVLTKAVSIPGSGPAPFALDEFGRTTTNGWGAADSGATWLPATGSAANFSVSGGVGQMTLGTAGADRQLTLDVPPTTDTDMRLEVGADKAATGGGLHLTAIPRRTSGGDRYYAKALYLNDGTVKLILGKLVGAGDVTLSTKVTGISVSPGDRLSIRVQAKGTSPTLLSAKLWKSSGSEPSAWTASVSDTTPELQQAGSLGARAYLSGSATNAPQVVSFDHLWAGPTG